MKSESSKWVTYLGLGVILVISAINSVGMYKSLQRDEDTQIMYQAKLETDGLYVYQKRLMQKQNSSVEVKQ